MPYFPQFGGMTTQKGYAAGLEFRTLEQITPGGKRFSRAELAAPLFQASLVYSSISDATKTALEAFFADREGQLREFTFLDPDGNLLSYSEDLTQAYWVKTNAAITPGAADPFGGTHASTVTGSAGGAAISAPFCPDGGVSGFVFCVSAWVKTATASVIRLGFDDGGAQLVDIPTGPAWRRVTATRVLASAGVPQAILEVGNQAVTVFGVQVSPLPGPGIYAKTPGGEGLRNKCRFATDDLALTAVGPDEWSARLTIRQFA